MRSIYYHYFFLLILLFFSYSDDSFSKTPEVEFPNVVVKGIGTEIKIDLQDPNVHLLEVEYNKTKEKLEVKDGVAIIHDVFHEKELVTLKVGSLYFENEMNPIPLWWSIFPPLIAIGIALLFKEVLSSLLLGTFFGAAIIYLYSDGLAGLLYAFMALIDTYVIYALFDKGHLSIIVFSMLIGGMVSIVSKNGGMKGIVNRISVIATSAKRGQFATWLLGVAIFFDDYANTLVVGNTMRPITDKLRISREKLAYLVDATAAPVASIAFITTWIGAELSYIESGIATIDGLNESVYMTFLHSLKYSFYPILTLIFILIIIFKGKDFGPMLKAEKRARSTGEVLNPETLASLSDKNNATKDFEMLKGVKPKAYNAIVPVLIIVFGTLAGLVYTGWDQSVWVDDNIGLGQKASEIIGNSDSFLALLWSSFLSLLVAIFMSIKQKIMDLNSCMDAMVKGFNTMVPAILILILAWALAMVTEDLHTADFLSQLLSDNASVYFIPVITFLLSAVVAFSTGSSWGSMAILYPLMLPAAWKISQESGMNYSDSLAIFHNVVSCVLAGAVLGDHCSPISDTTILSSLSSSCNHMDHVNTQMPYALTVGIVGITVGTIPSAFGMPIWISYGLGILALFLIVHFYGKSIPNFRLSPNKN